MGIPSSRDEDSSSLLSYSEPASQEEDPNNIDLIKIQEHNLRQLVKVKGKTSKQNRSLYDSRSNTNSQLHSPGIKNQIYSGKTSFFINSNSNTPNK